MRDALKIKKNLLMGIFGQLTAIILGVLVPKLILINYGSEINGLLSSVTNIYAYVAIVEAGITAASCQALYKPVAEKKQDRINAVMSATNEYYHRAGMIYFTLILLLSALYPLIIHSEISYITIFQVILFNGIGNVINFFFHGKYLILLKADGKNYIRTGLDTVINAVKQISKIFLIRYGFDVVSVQFASMMVSFLQMVYISLYVRKNYSWIDLKVMPDKSAISQSRNVFVHEINYLITSNADTVLLSIFTTLQTVSVYSLYNLLFSMINRILRTIRESLEFKIAYLYHTNNKEFLKTFRTFEAYYMMMAFSAFTITSYFVTPFIKLYTAGVSDAQYVDSFIPYLFVIINLLSCGRYPLDAMVHISGHFKRTQRSAACESCINVVTSVILIQFLGIYGVLLGTIFSSLYRAAYLVCYVNKNILNSNFLATLRSWGSAFITYILIDIISRYIQPDMSTYGQIIAVCIPYSLGVVAAYAVSTSIGNPGAFRLLLGIVRASILKKMK